MGRLVVLLLTGFLATFAIGFAADRPSDRAKGAAAPLTCPSFTQATLPEPSPQADPEAMARFQAINAEARAASHTFVFLGDSLTQKWDRSLWNQNLARLDALNAGVNGDRTEHLLWRIKHGNLDGQRPDVVVLLIGTNDVGHNRPATIIAQGVRAILTELRSRVPTASILLLGVLPRSESPSSERRRQVYEVNQLIQTCGDGKHILYADIGEALLDGAGRLSRDISPDGVHLSQRGYALLTRQLETEFGKLPAIR